MKDKPGQLWRLLEHLVPSIATHHCLCFFASCGSPLHCFCPCRGQRNWEAGILHLQWKPKNQSETLDSPPLPLLPGPKLPKQVGRNFNLVNCSSLKQGKQVDAGEGQGCSLGHMPRPCAAFKEGPLINCHHSSHQDHVREPGVIWGGWQAGDTWLLSTCHFWLTVSKMLPACWCFRQGVKFDCVEGQPKLSLQWEQGVPTRGILGLGKHPLSISGL